MANTAIPWVPWPKSSTLYSCPVCHRNTFKTAPELRKHQLSQGHRIPCTQCNKSFLSLHDSHQHQVVHNKPRKPWACSSCNRKFASESALGKHEIVHTKPPQQIPCTRCNRKFLDSAALSRHIINHREADSPPRILAAIEAPPETPPEAPDTISPSAVTGDKPAGPNLLQMPLISGDLATANTVANNPYNNNRFAVLGPCEQDSIYQELQAKCHPISRLTAQRFTMSSTPKHWNPGNGVMTVRDFRHTPYSIVKRHEKRKVVVIRCEMVTVFPGLRHIASIAAVDFLTGDQLLNQYVYPMSRIVNYNSRYRGIIAAMMDAAQTNGTALQGWEAARLALWNHIDQDTVLIGHALENDLNALGIFHTRVVDSRILIGERIFPAVKTTSRLRHREDLKSLTRELVHYDIKIGRKTHAVLEDAYAIRDVVIWCLRYPHLLDDWADRAQQRDETNMMQNKRRAKNYNKKKKMLMELRKPMNEPKKPAPVQAEFADSTQSDEPCDQDSEVELWFDLSEPLTLSR
ncbi:ribonuclease H-like protein [Aspergillus bertholletiae]|uniref:Ribonuclease H-like protein n=1 Tax=Aspergillus bertholletiae TaxID=1226010 RepID=A0A5N7B709_9EURO|nr:ribonuclease H-like protein [Aspergillus bertholletiae]